MLDDRKTAILSAVVQEYIATALPVGSTHIADAPGVRVSSATVRNEMAVLEQEGYLVQPHTSAGRIPTDKGYRFFVDHLATPGRLDAATRSEVGEFFRTAHGRLEEMLHRTSDLLAHLTNYAAVVVGPRAEAVAVRSVQVVGLSSTMATVVVVLGNGSVESQTIELDPDVTDAHLAAASTHLAGQLVGSSLADAAALVPSGDEIVDRLCADALQAVRDQSGGEHALRRRDVGDGLGVRRRGDRPRRAAHAGAAVRRRLARRRPRPARPVRGDRHRARRRAAGGVLGRRRAGRRRRRAARLGRACSGRRA